MKMIKDKKAYLKSYLLQQSKISRLNQMALKNPTDKSIYKKQIDECKRARKQIEQKIQKLDNEVLREVLFQKYICGKTLIEIGLILNYSTRHTERLHRAALEQLKI